MRTEFIDNRKELRKGDVIKSSEREYIIDSCIGKGSNAIVYYGYYLDQQLKDQKHWILLKELFPLDENNAIRRVQNGNIVVERSAENFYKLHRDSYEKGNKFHSKLLEDIPGVLDYYIDTFSFHNTEYSILVFSGGRSLCEELEEKTDLSLLRIVSWMKGLLNILKVFHEERYLHLDISVDNILLSGKGEEERINLIDYNSIVSLEEVQGDNDIILSAKNEYAAPEVLRAAREKIGVWTDLYSATAVFFHLLFNRGRSVVERKNRFSLPDVSESVSLQKQNPIVLDMIATILKKGFEANVRLRYQSADEMRKDLDELEERIRCYGITHWALWQKGRDYVINIVKRNTALRYITDSDNIYPLRAERINHNENQKNNIIIADSDASFLKEMPEERPVLLLGSGGMGKTTAMLRMAYEQPDRYTPGSTAIIYLSLFGWKNNDRTFIQDSILNNLNYNHDLLENARKQLRNLLSEPIHTKYGDVPKLLLCLDGLNEAIGDISPLLEEIVELCALPGVKIMITSRSEITGDRFEKWVLLRLEHEDIRNILNKNEIPDPENMEIMELLYIPMMLSMYIQALDGRKIIKLDSKEQLLEEFLVALVNKEGRNPLQNEIAQNEQNNPMFWGAQAAVLYVLPEIAGMADKKQGDISETDLFRLLEECYKDLSNRALTAVFENWIGHTEDLKLGSNNADEWYGKIVLALLWKRLGLLIMEKKRDAEGKEKRYFHLSHQFFQEYMTAKYQMFHKEMNQKKKQLRNRRRWYAAMASMFLVGAFGLYNTYMRYQVEIKKTEAQKKEANATAYSSRLLLEYGDRYHAVENLLQVLPSEDNDCPVVKEAEDQLRESLYCYQDVNLRPVCVIEQLEKISDYIVSNDGKYVVTISENNALSCYSSQSGELLWSKSVNANTDEMFFIDESTQSIIIGCSYVSLFDSDEGIDYMRMPDLYAYSLMDGEIMTEVYFNEEEKRGPLTSYLSRLFPSKDGKVYAIANSDENKIQFWDAETWQCFSETNAISLEKHTDNSHYIYAEGILSEDHSLFAAIILEEDMVIHAAHLLLYDTANGELVWEKELPIPIENITTNLLEYEMKFLQNNRLLCSSIIQKGEDVSLSLACFEEDGSICYNKEGSYLSNKKIGMQCVEAGERLELMLSDEGLILDINTGEVLSEDGIKADDYVQDCNSFSVHTYTEQSQEKKIAIFRPSNDDSKLLVFNTVGDDSNRLVHFEEINQDYYIPQLDTIRTQVIGDGSRIFYFDEIEGELTIVIRDAKTGEILSRGKGNDEFSPHYTLQNEYSGVSNDGSKLFFLKGNRSSLYYDIVSSSFQQLPDYPGHSDDFWMAATSLWQESQKTAILLREREEDCKNFTLYWWDENNAPKTYVFPYDLGIDASGYEKADSRVVIGNSGLIAIQLTKQISVDGKKSGLLIFSTDSLSVVGVDIPLGEIDPFSGGQEQSILAVGDSNKLVAVADLEGKIQIIDGETGDIITSFDNPYHALDSMQFIIDDDYLLLKNNDERIVIVNISDGTTVFQDELSGNYYDGCCVWTNEEERTIYISGYTDSVSSLRTYNKNTVASRAIAVDMDNMTVKYYIDDFIGYLSDSNEILRETYDPIDHSYYYKVYPVHDLTEMMQMGKDVLISNMKE